MIRNLYIDNFKSLVDFSLPPDLGQFICLIGLNSSGKSTLLHAFDFLSHLVTGKVDDWLKRREWHKSDLTSRFLKKQLITFRLGFEFPQCGRVEWEGSFNVNLLRCTAETIRTADGRDVLKIVEGGLRAANAGNGADTVFPLSGLAFQGSVLSLLKATEYHLAIAAVKDFVGHLRSLDMLSPQLMRKRAKDADDVGYGGERLSAYLHGFSKEAKDRLLTTLQGFYGQVEGWETSALRAGWKDLGVRESYRDAHGKPLETMARQLNDGMLRVLAILAQTQTGNPEWESDPLWWKTAGRHQEYYCLLFDEIENGINPEIVGKLIAYLLAVRQQIIVTSHSPMILNYLPDAVAREAVLLLYRTPQGTSRAVRFFDLPETSRKLQLLGPGEVFVDTDLAAAAQVAEQQRSAKS